MGVAKLTRWGGVHPLETVTNTPGFAVTTFNVGTAGYKVAMTFQFPGSNGADTITTVGYRQGTTTLTPAAASYKIGVQGVSTSTGNPDGTYLGGGSPASVEFQPTSADDGKWVWKTLDNGISITPGQTIALVLETGSGFTAGNSITAGHYVNPGTRVANTLPQSYNGSWTKRGTDVPLLAAKSASYVYGYPIKTGLTTRSFGGTSEVGMWFNVPTHFGDSFKLVGVNALVTTPSAAKTVMVNVYENPLSGSIASVQASEQFDSDYLSVANSQVRLFECRFATATAPTLSTGTDYVIGFSSTTASDMAIYTLDAEASGDFEAFAHGQSTAYTTRTLTSYPPSGDDTNNFAAVTATSRPWVELILADITAPSGGSGLLVHPGMAGGMRG